MAREVQTSPVSLDKGIGFPRGVTQRRSNVLREDLSLPCAVLLDEQMRRNSQWMRAFAADSGAHLAPHGKTSMAPKLFSLQMEDGAWGITAATAQQAAVAAMHGVERVLMANQLVGRANMATVAWLLADPKFEFYCLVDSAELVDLLGAFFSERKLRLRMLIEVGVMGGRTGVRDEAQLDALLAALARWNNTLELSGVEVYEGVLDDEAVIRTLLRRTVDLMRRLLRERRLARTPAVLSGAGSAWYDVVAEEFSVAGFGPEVERVLRPGCYLTHDVGAYCAAQQKIEARSSAARAVTERLGHSLEPALEIWAVVLSRPEPERAIVGFGKRDVAFDSGLPVPALWFRPGANTGNAAPAPTPAPAHWKVTKLMDQHAYLQLAAGDDVHVGDLIGFDIAHPCLTFDRWRVLARVDANYNVLETVETYF